MFVISDLHWRCDTPSWRKETKYGDVLRDKMQGMLNAANENESVVIAGDVFHRATDFNALYDLYVCLSSFKPQIPIYAVRGQHDMLFHSKNFEATAFNLLVEAGLIIPLTNEPLEIEGFSVVGMNWGDAIPETPSDILVAHVSVNHGEDTIPGAETARAFRAKAKDFRYVFTGDNHKRFEVDGLYNAGCFHRMTADLVDQTPAVWRVIDGEVTLHELCSSSPLVNEAYIAKQSKEKKMAAGEEFVAALSSVRGKGGADTFLMCLRTAEAEATGAVKETLADIIQQCEEVRV